MDVVKEGKRRAYSTGETVIATGEASNSMYIMCSGTVSCLVCGREVKQITAGNSFGDMAIFFRIVRALLQEHQDILGEAGPLDKM